MGKYEFGGPLGAFAISVACPIFSYLFYFLCNDSGCPQSSFLSAPVETFKNEMWPGWGALFDARVMGAYLAWFFGLVVMQYVMPGAEGEGVELRNGQRLKYKFNGLQSFASVLAYCAFETYRNGWEWTLWSWIWDNYLQLITAAFIFSTAQACYTYAVSFVSGELLAEHGDTGNPIYDWFIGRPLNPRIGSFDLKVFSELRPGLMLWIVFNIAFMAHQAQAHGRITDSMVLVNVFQAWYVTDSLVNEPAVLTTIDVISDGFGFMLSMGDLLWVPFTYSLQARYLAQHPVDLGPSGVAGVLAVQAAGYWIFRGANGQKNKFRTNPEDPAVKHIEYIQTKTGSRLMTSGWWGMARHINYLGDWLMAWAWCLPTGFSTPLPYYYVVYFAVLLIHRERRDEAKCMAKYGEDWEKYKKKVPYRIIPGLY